MITRHPIAAFSRRLLAGAALLSLPAISTSRAETFTLEEATIDQIQKAMADGALSSVELNSMYLNRIAVYDQNRGGLFLNSIPVPNPKALLEAQNADRLRASGTVLGPLHGIPVGVKDTMAVAGLPLTHSDLPLIDLKAVRDCFIVDLVRKQGSVVLGKASVDTRSGGRGPSAVYGQIRNAYDRLRDPGGSSKGSAISVAANFVTYSLGGETGSSIRWPAASNAVVGMRPTLGLVSTEGTFTLDGTRDVVGPMSRNVGDLAYVLEALVVRDPADKLAKIIPTTAYQRPATYPSALSSATLAGKRIGVIKQYGSVNRALHVREVGDSESVDDETYAAFEAAKQELIALGATLIEVDVPAVVFWHDEATDYADYYAEYAALGAPEGFVDAIGFRNLAAGPEVFHWEALWTGYGDGSITTYDQYMAFPAEDRSEALASLEDLAALREEGLVVSLLANPYNLQFQNAVTAYYQKNYAAYLAEQNLDALVAPTMFRVPELLGIDQNYDLGNGLVNELGVAGITVPIRFSSDGLPIGLQFWGLRYDETNILQLARAYEQGTRHRKPSPLVPPLPGETIEYSTALPPPSRPELNAPALRVAGGAKVTGKGKKATLVLTGGAVDASGLGSLTVYVNGKKIAAKRAANWKASVKLSALRKLVRGDAKTVSVQVVAKDIYGNTSVTTKTVKLPKAA